MIDGWRLAVFLARSMKRCSLAWLIEEERDESLSGFGIKISDPCIHHLLLNRYIIVFMAAAVSTGASAAVVAAVSSSKVAQGIVRGL